MNRLFKYILLLIIAACGLACSEEVDLTTYKALEIEYVTSNRQAISNLRQWHGEDSYSIIADTYQENSNRGSLFVYPDVSTFGVWFQGCENLTEVHIPGGISSIGVRAFEKCANLKSVTIPESLSYIGIYAFKECESLESITIPDSVTTIGRWAFEDCSSLTSVYCAATTPPVLGGTGVFDNSASGRKIYVPTKSVDAYKSAEYWSEYADAIVGYNFETGEEVMPDEMRNRVIYYTATRKVEAHSVYPWTYDTFGANIVSHEWNSETGEGVITFDADLTMIGDYAFAYCSSLTSVTIPDSVTKIGYGTFYDCSSLTSVTIGDSVTTIGARAFRDCYSLTSITIPNSVTTIGEEAFSSCKSLTSVTIGDSVTTIGDYAFGVCSSLTSVYCEATTPPILGFSVFVNNASGRKIYVPTESVDAYKSAEYWSEYADAIVGYNFETGEEVMPDEMRNRVIYYTATRKVEAYSDYPWAYDTFGANVVSNEWNSETCEGIITFDGDVTTIGDYAFYYCYSLTSVTIPASVTTIGRGAFDDCDSLTSVTIPDSVTTIGDWAFRSCSSLTSVTIGNSVTTIGYAAFEYCSSLTSVTIPDSVTTIGDGAFYNCSSLTSVYCTATTPPVLGGNYVFDDNGSGRKIYVPTESVDAYKSAEYWSNYADAIVGYNFETGEEVMPDEMRNRVIYYTATRKVEAYSDYPWAYDTFGANVVSNEWNSKTSEGAIAFDAEVTTIGDYAFAYCYSLSSATIPDSVTAIGDSAFYNCTSLTSITIPDSVMTIGYRAFYNCSRLTSVTIPDGVTTIGDAAFCHCSNLTSVTIPDSVTTIGHSAFAFCSSLTSVTIPNSVTTIGNSTFNDCTSLTSVTIPDSVTTIGEEAFRECTSLTSVTIGDGVITIGNSAFNDCSSLTSVTIPDSVTTIGDFAFYNCTNLTSITIPDSVTTIGDYAFKYCSSLTSVYCEATTPPSLGGSSVFDDYASGRLIYVPAASVEAYKTADYWSEYADAIIAYDFENGVVVEPEVSVNNEIRYTATAKVEAHSAYPWTYDTFGANIVSHEWNSESGEGVITFDADVTTIGYSAFYDCSSLTSVTIPDSVMTIGDNAFVCCGRLAEFKGKFASEDGRCLIVDGTLHSFAPAGLVSYTIPNGVTTIGDRAFYNCTSLTSVIIPDSVTTIGVTAFYDCESLTSVTIPDSVTMIGDYAFKWCYSLTSVTIGNSVTTIGDSTFYGCSSLTSVAIPDSVTTIGDLAFSLCESLTSVTIGNSVTTIEDSAFSWCENLISVYCEAITPPSLGSNVFYVNGSGRKIYVPAESVDAYKSAEYWSDYADAIVGYDFNTTITPDGGIDDAEEDDEVIL